MDNINRHYKSQYNQDKIIDDLVDKHTNGVFVEVGAYDGVDISNTFFFEKIRDWKGLVIEPIPSKHEQLVQNRWCYRYKGCAYSCDSVQLPFMHIDGYSEMLSTLKDNLLQKYQERIDKEVKDHNQQVNIIQVDCSRIDSLMNKFQLGNKIDYLSLDAQGHEYDVLQGLGTILPKVISYDTNGYNDEKVIMWMNDNKYRELKRISNTDEIIYINDYIKWTWEYN